MEFIRTLPDGKPQVIKDAALCALLDFKPPKDDLPFTDLLRQMDAKVMAHTPVSKGALSNEIGRAHV